jgi:hypothetical protein
MMREVEFFTKSPAIMRLTSEERKKIKRIFMLYRFLHYHSISPEGFEEGAVIQDRTGELKIFSNGIFEPIRNIARQHIRKVSQSRSSATQYSPISRNIANSPLDLLKQKYQYYRLQRQHILEAEDNLIVKTRGEVEIIEHEMASSARAGNKYQVIACLKVLARQGALADSLKRNAAWLDATAEYIRKKYGQTYAAADLAYAVSDQKMQPEAPALVAEFLQYILKAKLLLSENDSALIGSEIGQLMGGYYQSMAYGNSETGDFEWAKNKIVERKFVSEV